MARGATTSFAISLLSADMIELRLNSAPQMLRVPAQTAHGLHVEIGHSALAGCSAESRAFLMTHRKISDCVGQSASVAGGTTLPHPAMVAAISVKRTLRRALQFLFDLLA